ncbi:MAG: 30S ribosomal protein S3 [Candidatus Spechtbacterales bacterium]
MTHKSHPVIKRLGIIKGWNSRWFNAKNYQSNVRQDHFIREYITNNYKNAGIANVEIERFANSTSVIIGTSRPGILIGRGGSGIEDMKKGLLKVLVKEARKFGDEVPNPANIRIEVREVRETEANASLIALNVAEQLERRIPFRRVIKRTLDRVVSHREVQGVKIAVKGRLNGTEMARAEFVKQGKLPLQTLRADIDYAHEEAITKYGVIGVKVWIYKGEKLE